MDRIIISSGTRLKAALYLDSRVIDYVVSLDPHDFGRLHNPVMRRLMAPRITLGRVAAMAGVPVGKVLEDIAALGGVAVEPGCLEEQLPQSPEAAPPWVAGVESSKARTVDLLPLDDALDADPMPLVHAGRQGAFSR